MKPTLRIVHVDDSPNWRHLVSDAVEVSGIGDVLELPTVEDARQYIQQFPEEVDFIICDGSVDRPDDGLEFAKELQAAGHKVIVLSAGEKVYGISFFSKGDFRDGKSFLSNVQRILSPTSSTA